MDAVEVVPVLLWVEGMHAGTLLFPSFLFLLYAGAIVRLLLEDLGVHYLAILLATRKNPLARSPRKETSSGGGANAVY